MKSVLDARRRWLAIVVGWPLVAVGCASPTAPHQVKPFASTSDCDYLAIRAWIAAGVSH